MAQAQTSENDNRSFTVKKNRLLKATFIILVSALFFSSLLPAQSGGAFNRRVVEFLDVRPGMKVADIGAGRGQLSFLMAEKVGEDGHIYANEINTRQIERMDKTIEERGLTNVTTVISEEADPALPSKVDLIILKFVYHHLSKPDVFMQKTREYLNPGGRLVIIASDVNQASESVRNRANRDACISDPDETRKAIEENGYIFDKVEFMQNGNDVEYVLIFKASDIEARIDIPWTSFREEFRSLTY